MTGEAPRTLLSVFATFAVGGAQVRYAALANRFGARYRHLIVAMDGDDSCRQRLSPRLDVTFLPVAIRKGATLANLRAFRRCLRNWQPDLLITHNWGSIEWAMANLPPLARHVHIEDGFGPEERDRQFPRRVLTRRLALHWSTVALPSQTLSRLVTEVWRLPRQHVHYIPNGVDITRFPGTHRAETAAAWNGQGPVIGTVAALRAEKNLARLLRAFAVVRRTTAARLAIVGDGPERPALQDLAVSLGVDGAVSFLGHCADPAPLYAGFDLFALSSDTEQMPISVIEAMASGLPVAATDVGDVRVMLSAENAGTIGPRDDEALAGSLATLLRDATLRARIGAANRAKALRDFDQERMFSAYAALLDAVPPP